MTRASAVWTELEREAHRVVLDLVQRKQHIDDPQKIAGRILLARRDLSATARDEYLEALADVIRKYIDVLV